MSEQIVPQEPEAVNDPTDGAPPIRTFGMTFNAERLAIGRLIKAGKLPKLAGWVYENMVPHVNRRTGQLNVSYETIAEEAGVSVRTVGECARALTEAGFFAVESKRNAAGHTYHIYTPLNIDTGAPLYAPGNGQGGSEARRKSYGKRRQTRRQTSANPEAKDSTSQRHSLPDNQTVSPTGRETVREQETAFAPRPSGEGGRGAVSLPEISDELLGDVWQGFAKSIRQLRAKAVTDRYIYRSDLYGDLARKHKIDEDTAHAVMTELVARGKCELRDEGRQTRVFVRGDVFAPFDPTPTPRHQPVTPATGVNETGTPGPEPENEVVEADGMPEPEKEIARENLGDEADKGWNDLSPVEKRARLLEETGESIADAALRQRLGIGIRKLATIDPNTREWAGLMGFWDELFERATGMDAEKALASLLTTSQPEVEHALPF